MTTSFDPANRPTSASDGSTYNFDLDGRLTARPSQRLAWDDLSRLTNVKPSVGETPLAAYTYDGLDRLRTVTYADGSRIRFRYVGLSTAVDQVLDDASGSAQRSVATGLTGDRPSTGPPAASSSASTAATPTAIRPGPPARAGW